MAATENDFLYQVLALLVIFSVSYFVNKMSENSEKSITSSPEPKMTS